MIKGPLTIKIEGPQGSGKTTLLNMIICILTSFGKFKIVVDEDNHYITVKGN